MKLLYALLLTLSACNSFASAPAAVAAQACAEAALAASSSLAYTKEKSESQLASAAGAGAAAALANTPRRNKSKSFMRNLDPRKMFQTDSQRLLEELNQLKENEVFESHDTCADTALLASGLGHAIKNKNEKEIAEMLPLLKRHKAKVDTNSRRAARAFSDQRIARESGKAKAVLLASQARIKAFMQAEAAKVAAEYQPLEQSIKQWQQLKSDTYRLEECDSDEGETVDAVSAAELQTAIAGAADSFPSTPLKLQTQGAAASSKKRKLDTSAEQAYASATQQTQESQSATAERPPAYAPQTPSAPPAAPEMPSCTSATSQS